MKYIFIHKSYIIHYLKKTNMGKITIFTEKDYEYFCMFSHLSNIDDEYEHPELIDNGLIELRKKCDGSKAYVYQYFPNKFTVGHFVTEIINGVIQIINHHSYVNQNKNIKRYIYTTIDGEYSLFEQDYELFNERMNIIKSELLSVTWNEERIQDWCLSIQYS